MSANQENGLRDESIAELVKRLADQTSTLVRQEIELAKAELTEKGKVAGSGAAMLGAAGLVGLLALGALTACLIALLATAVDHVWLAALIVTVVYAAIAAPLALRGRDRLRAATPPAPQETIESVKEDVAWAKNRTRSATR
ncbi:MAG TPA: phage holin family protein [Conexibacter sp.]|nr:phage holin family protein [Conexibacter sp.]